MLQPLKKTPSPQPSPRGERGKKLRPLLRVRGQYKRPFSPPHPLADADLERQARQGELAGEGQDEGVLT